MRFTIVALLVLLSMEVCAQNFQIVFLNKNENKAALPEEEVKKLMDAHLANINRLAKEGKLLAAGPFDGGGGIFIFKSSSRDEVNSWIMTDAAVAAGRWIVEIFPYQPRIGSVCVVEESAKMTSYFFVRYKSGKDDKSETDTHLGYLKAKAASVITEASLGSGNGSILVLREEPTDWIQSDPSVKSGSLVAEVKKLWIGLGSFCESN